MGEKNLGQFARACCCCLFFKIKYFFKEKEILRQNTRHIITDKTIP